MLQTYPRHLDRYSIHHPTLPSILWLSGNDQLSLFSRDLVLTTYFISFIEHRALCLRSGLAHFERGGYFLLHVDQNPTQQAPGKMHVNGQQLTHQTQVTAGR